MERGCGRLQARGWWVRVCVCGWWVVGGAGKELDWEGAPLVLIPASRAGLLIRASIFHRSLLRLWLQVAGAQLRGCSWGPTGAHGTGPDALSIHGLRPSAPLAPLLEALCPAGRPLHRLHLGGGSTLKAAALRACGDTAKCGEVRELRLQGCY